MSRLWCRSRTNSGYNRCSKHPLPSVWRIRCLKLDYRYRTNEGTYTGATPRSLGPSEALGAARRSPYDHNLLARLGDVQLVSWSQLLSSIRYTCPADTERLGDIHRSPGLDGNQPRRAQVDSRRFLTTN